MNNIDIELLTFINCLNLKVEDIKKYSIKCDSNTIYVFNNYLEYKKYFIDNGFVFNNETQYEEDLIKNYIVYKTKTGKIIAFKALCDSIINKYNINKEKKLVKRGNYGIS